MDQLGENNCQSKTCPTRTLSQEELSENDKQEAQTTNKTQKRKTGSISCCFSTQKKTKTKNRKQPLTVLLPQPFLTENEMQDLKGQKNKARPKWKPNLSYIVAHKNNQTPRIDSSSGETARVDSGGCGAPLETKQDDDNHNT